MYWYLYVANLSRCFPGSEFKLLPYVIGMTSLLCLCQPCPSVGVCQMMIPIWGDIMDNGKPIRVCRPHRISESSKVNVIFKRHNKHNCRTSFSLLWQLCLLWPMFTSQGKAVLRVCGICRCSAGWIKPWMSCGASMSSGGTVSSVMWCWLLTTSGSLLTEPSLPFPAHTSTPCSPWAWGRSARRRYKRIIDYLEPADLFLWNGERWWSRKPHNPLSPLITQ